MKKQDAIKIFEEKKVRTVWHSEQEKWFFSIVDVIAVLSDSPNPQVYWRVMKKRLKDEGNETVTNCNGLKKENLRDNMTNTELVLNMLAETSTKDISQALNPVTFDDNMSVAQQGGNVARVARLALENRTGKNVVTELNAKTVLGLKEDNIDNQ